MTLHLDPAPSRLILMANPEFDTIPHRVQIVADLSSQTVSFVCSAGEGRDGFPSDHEARAAALRHASIVSFKA
jgi:hypothetical protein